LSEGIMYPDFIIAGQCTPDAVNVPSICSVTWHMWNDSGLLRHSICWLTTAAWCNIYWADCSDFSWCLY